MNKLTGFDSKEYRRSNALGELKFYTPLGCGVTVANAESFYKKYTENLRGLSKGFGISQICGCLSSSEYFARIGPAKTYKLSDEVLKSVQGSIESVYFSYIVLPPDKNPKVEVGGFRCPVREIGTFDFMRQVSTYFSYITAWSYLGIESRKDERIVIDGFHGKHTKAWEDLVARTTPLIYSHGDECNPFISIADIVAFLADKKLWDNKMKLEPESIEEVWKDYSFKVVTHFLDREILSKIKWYNEEHIDLTSYYVHPIVFIRADGYRIDDLKKLSVYPKATVLARQINGCVQGFDKSLDSAKIKDGDMFIYAGEESGNMANTLKDIYDIEVLPFKEIDKKIETP